MTKHQPPTSQIHPSAIVDAGATIGPGTKIWHFSHVQAGAHVGAGCVIGQNCSIAPTAKVGDGCKLQNNVSVFAGVTLGRDVFCGPSCVFTNVLTPRADVDRRDAFVETRVGDGATIGANATVLCGVSIGPRAMIGAGAVVTRDIPAHALVAGNPARQIGWVCTCGCSLKGRQACPGCGRKHPLAPTDQLPEDTQ